GEVVVGAGERVARGRGFDKGRGESFIYKALFGHVDVATVVRSTPGTGFIRVPSSIRLAGAEIEMVGLIAREQRLRRILAPLRGGFEVTLIDCPPSAGLPTVNALTPADTGPLPISC